MTYDSGTLDERLQALQRNRPDSPRAHVRAAQDVLDFGLREERGSGTIVCAHHELMNALCHEDDIAHAERTAAMSARLVSEDAEFEATPWCQVCMWMNLAYAENARERFDAALEALERAKQVMDAQRRTYGAVNRGAQVVWAMIQTHLLRGDDAAALECAELHDSERAVLVRGAEQKLKDNPEWADDSDDFYVRLLKYAPEYYAEVAILRSLGQGAYAEAREAIEAYFAAYGDGASGMARVLNTYARVLIRREAWEALVASAPMLDREFCRRQYPRWRVETLLGAARAHQALGQHDQARRVYYEIEGLRPELFKDDLAEAMQELKALIFG